MTQQANAIVLSLLAIMLACSFVLAGAITIGSYVKTHHDDVNKPRMNPLIEQALKRFMITILPEEAIRKFI